MCVLADSGFIMPLPARALIILALFVAGTNCAFSQTAGLKNESNSSVTGKVTIKDKPAAGIVVGMHLARPERSSPTYKAITNQDGIYRINNIARGTYVIAPVAPAMVISDENNPLGQTVLITVGDSVDGVDFNLVRGAVITGKVTDADGRPVVETWVTLTNVQPPNQPGSSYNIPEGQTDDRGIYRIFGVHAGHYKVEVHDNHQWSRGGPPVMPATYYPDVQEADKATIVDGRVNERSLIGSPSASISTVASNDKSKSPRAWSAPALTPDRLIRPAHARPRHPLPVRRDH